MRNMSFSHTTQQVIDRTKTVTRRDINTWKTLKVGDRLKAVAKCMGLKKGEKVKVLAIIEVVSVTWLQLGDISDEDVHAEGFPHWTRYDFIRFFIKTFKTYRAVDVRRIEFKYIDEESEDG